MPRRSPAPHSRRRPARLADTEVTGLTTRERGQLINAYLGQYAKTLPNSLVNDITADPKPGTRSYLRLLLEELRIYGDHDTLTDRLRELLSAPDIPGLYMLILSRWEHDYERDRPHLVRDVSRLLWAARRGLSETELLELLGDDSGPLAHAAWAPLALAAKQTFTNRDGLIGAAHRHASQAIQHRYLPDTTLIRETHRRLANYFRTTSALQHVSEERWRSAVRRALDEIPWQLAEARDWTELSDLLANPAVTAVLNDSAPFELRRYWTRIESHSHHRLIAVYAPISEHDETREEDQLFAIADLLRDTGHPEPALAIYKHLEERNHELEDRSGRAAALGNQAHILRSLGKLDGALSR